MPTKPIVYFTILLSKVVVSKLLAHGKVTMVHDIGLQVDSDL